MEPSPSNMLSKGLQKRIGATKIMRERTWSHVILWLGHLGTKGWEVRATVMVVMFCFIGIPWLLITKGSLYSTPTQRSTPCSFMFLVKKKKKKTGCIPWSIVNGRSKWIWQCDEFQPAQCVACLALQKRKAVEGSWNSSCSSCSSAETM